MAKKPVGASRVGPAAIPILKSEIEEAQRNTNSNASAAKFLGVSYQRYKRYAKIYGIFESHTNQKGVGISKGFAMRDNSIPLKNIFANKHPLYSMVRLRYRLLARHMIEEKCSMCGFEEKRIIDGRSPLILTFKNGQRDYAKDNLCLMCYNCLFLTTRAPWAAHKFQINSSLTNPDFPQSPNDHQRISDFSDPTDDELYDNLDMESIKKEAMDELNSI